MRGSYESEPSGFHRDKSVLAEVPYDSVAQLSPDRSRELRRKYDVPALPNRFITKELYVELP